MKDEQKEQTEKFAPSKQVHVERIVSKDDICLLYDLLFIYDRLYWNNDTGRRQAQELIDEIHAGKYGDRQGCYVQFSNVLQKLKGLVG